MVPAVKGTVNGATMVYVGNHFEWSGSTGTMKKYYYASGVRVAMRKGSGDPKWLLADHLGSSTIMASFTGSRLAELAYKGWGENRYTYGTTPTTYRYTGQRQEILLGGLDGLYYYGARWYDSSLSRFVQADSIIPQPGNPLAWDRYAYVLNNASNILIRQVTIHIVVVRVSTNGTLIAQAERQPGPLIQEILDTL